MLRSTMQAFFYFFCACIVRCVVLVYCVLLVQHIARGHVVLYTYMLRCCVAKLLHCFVKVLNSVCILYKLACYSYAIIAVALQHKFYFILVRKLCLHVYKHCLRL